MLHKWILFLVLIVLVVLLTILTSKGQMKLGRIGSIEALSVQSNRGRVMSETSELLRQRGVFGFWKISLRPFPREII